MCSQIFPCNGVNYLVSERDCGQIEAGVVSLIGLLRVIKARISTGSPSRLVCVSFPVKGRWLAHNHVCQPGWMHQLGFIYLWGRRWFVIRCFRQQRRVRWRGSVHSQLQAHTSAEVCVSVSVGQCVREIIRHVSAGWNKVRGTEGKVLLYTLVHRLYKGFLDKPL